MREKAPPQNFVSCLKYLDKLNDDEDEDEVIHILEMIDIFKRINTVYNIMMVLTLNLIIMLCTN